MRILICHNFYQEPGGEDQVFADEGWLLESHGHEVIRYTKHNDEVAALGRRQLARQTLWNRQAAAEVRDLIAARRPDVMHCHNTFPLISPSIFAAANQAGVPVVQTLHNYRLLCPSALFLRNGKGCEDCLGKLVAWPGVLHGCYRGSRTASAVVAAMLAVHRMRRTWTRRVSQFIALSEFSRRKFVQGGLPADRIATKPNFMRQDPGPGNGQGGYALFVGRLSPEKGLDTLLAAWQRLQEPLPLKIIGDGPLAEQARTAAAGDSRITYLGRLPSTAVAPVLAEATCLVLPSICYENCPKTILEAYAAGTPVVGSRTGAIEEMIDAGRTGWLFEPGSPESLAACLQSVLKDDASLESMRHAARATYEQNYTADANYAALMAIYRRVLQKSDEPIPSSNVEEFDPQAQPGVSPAVTVGVADD